MTAAQPVRSPGQKPGRTNTEVADACAAQQKALLGAKLARTLTAANERDIAKKAFTAFKFDWLRQIASDRQLPPAAAPVAIVLADEYLNQETGDAWPAIDTLAAAIGRSVTQTREALQKMAGLDHVVTDLTRGGKGQVNRYRPILKPSGNPQGMESVKPSGIRHETLRKRPSKPSGNPQGNPYEDPYEDTSVGHKGRQTESRLSSRSKKAPRADAAASPEARRIRVGTILEHSEIGRYAVIAITPGERRVKCRRLRDGAEFNGTLRPTDIIEEGITDETPF
jgi:hypothetical protein